MTKVKKFIPLIILVAVMVYGYFAGWYQALNFETVRYHHNELTEYVNNSPIMTPFMYIGVYAFVTALSIPGGTFLSLIGGFLFPQPWCTLYVIVGATLGACVLFFIAKTAFRDLFHRKAGSKLEKMREGFENNAVSYMLFLRLVPLFPFWLVNIAPAFFKIRLRTYIWTTFVGILPGAFVITQAGRGLNSVFESAEDFSLASILTNDVKIALIGLALLALMPIVIKKWREKKRDRQ